VSVAQQGVMEGPDGPLADCARGAGYVCYIRSIPDI